MIFLLLVLDLAISLDQGTAPIPMSCFGFGSGLASVTKRYSSVVLDSFERAN